jgi:hypothetical protein
MDPTAIAVLIGTLVVVVVGVVALRRQGHPEDAASHEAEPVEQGPTGTPYPPGSRPAGPDAESMDPDEPSSPRDQPPGPR